MTLTVDTVIHGRDPGLAQNGVVVQLSDELFADIKKAVLAERAAASANNRRQPPKQPAAVQVSFTSSNKVMSVEYS